MTSRAREDPGAALRRAARVGDDDAVYALLLAGAPPNAADPRTGRTPLLEAVAADQLDTVAVLVGWVSVDRRAKDGRGRVVRTKTPSHQHITSQAAHPLLTVDGTANGAWSPRI